MTTFRDSDGVTRFAGAVLMGGTVGDVATVQADGTLAPASGGSQPPTGPVSIAFDDADIDTGLETALGVPADSIVDILVYLTHYWDPGDAGSTLKLAVGPVGGTFDVDTQDFVKYDLSAGNEGNASATLDPPIVAGATSQELANFMHHRFRTKTACAIFAQAVPGNLINPFTAGSADLYASVTAL